MARVFLSYAREDAATAKSIAKALERAGHQVWWDSHVHGGARFAAEIAEALINSEVVVVLWSRSSVQSIWVHDEASEGRDRGRLVPLSIDGTQPPLGFRQFQSIDLSHWSGRGRVPKLAAIEAAIATVLKGGSLARPAESPKQRRRLLATWHARAAASLVVLVLAVGVFLFGSGRLSAAPPTTLAVMPFADFSQAKDKAYFAEGVAEEIRTLLSDVDGVRVTGRTSTEMLGPTADFRQARERLGATHLLEGSLRVQGEKLKLNVRLVRTKDGIQVWAEEFDRDLNDVFAVQDEVGSAVARRLRGMLWGSPLDRRSTRTSVQAFDLVKAAEAKWEGKGGWTEKSSLEAEQLLKKAIEIDPNYAPAWVARSRNMYVLIGGARPEGAWGPKWLRDRELMLRYARRAVAVDPEHADAQAWLGYVEGENERPEVALARIEKAIELNPGDWRVWGLASLIYGQMCEHDKELEALRRVVAVEPLDLGHQRHLMVELYAQGRIREADELRRKLSQDPKIAEQIAVALGIQRGDFSTAVTRLLKQNANKPKAGVAHMLYGLGAIDDAISWLPSDYRKSVGAFWQHDYRRAAAEGEWLRNGYWNTARGFAITRAMVRSGRQRELVRLFDRRFGSVEEFDRRLRCALPAVAAPVIAALRAEGRSGEAERLVQLAHQRFRQGLAERHYDEDIHAGYVELLLVVGRREAALDALEQAIRRQGLRGRPPPVARIDLSDPVFNPIRNHPRFKAVERFVAAWRAKELRELAPAGVRIA